MGANLAKRTRLNFLQLNIYKKSHDKQPSTQKDLIATRIYLFGSVILILIIAFTSALSSRTITSVENSPSHTRFTQLLRHYPNTLNCPCSKFSISYSKFVFIKVRLHPVCSSEFVQQIWIDKIFQQYIQLSFSVDDHHSTLAFFWQIIANLCIISNTVWSNIITNLNGSYIFSPTALTEQSLRDHAQEVLKNEKLLAQISLTRNRRFLQSVISVSEFSSGVLTNFQLQYPSDTTSALIRPKMFAKKYGNCSCSNVYGCPHTATFNDTNGQLVTIPGMIADCLIVDGVLASTLECYYSQSCMSLLHQSLANDIQLLSTEAIKSFSMNSTIQTLFDEIMLDELVNNIRYDQYFSQCEPTYCAYSYSRRLDLFYVITTIISFFGVISMIIRVIAPLLAERYLKRNNKVASNIAVTQTVTVVESKRRNLSDRIRRIIVNLNLFEESTSRTLTVIHRERLLTRCFILLMTLSVIAVAFYTFLDEEDQVITIDKPTVETYYELNNHYPDSLKCSCSKLSIPYEKLLNISVILHQVCSSAYVSNAWINYLTAYDTNLIPSWTDSDISRDFRVIGASYFQMLNTFCSLADTNAKSMEKNFANTRFISNYVLSPTRFQQEMQVIIDSFMNTVDDSFAAYYDWFNIALTTGFFVSGANSNFQFEVNSKGTIDLTGSEYINVNSLTNDDFTAIDYCKCGTLGKDFQCNAVTVIYSNISDKFLFDFVFWQIKIGCIPIVGLISYDTSWWYDNTYLEGIKTSYAWVVHVPPRFNFTAMTQSVSTRFANASLQNLLEKLFVEEWILNSTHFDQFYSECAPNSCSYMVYERRRLIVVLLLFVAMCSGLNKVLRILLTFIGKALFTTISKWKNQNNVEEKIPITVRIRSFLKNITQAIINMNLFETEEQDELIIKQGRLYTKIYLALFISSLSVILIYVASRQHSMIQTFALNSFEEYELLHKLYQNDINCPCTRISIHYNEFITKLYVGAYHQLCKEKAVQNALFGGRRSEILTESYGNKRDFRYVDDNVNRTVSALCSLAKNNVASSTQTLLSSALVTNKLLSADQFENDINETIDRFQKKILIIFSEVISLIRTITQGNALIATFSYNWEFVVVDKDQGKNATFLTIPVRFNNTEDNSTCFCATSANCTMPAEFFNKNGSLRYTVKGFVLGCNVLETVLRSSVSCFYSRSCLYELWMMSYGITNIVSANKTLSNITFDSTITRFNIDDSIETLSSQMFIESWISDISYERYFNSCAPSHCTRTYYYRFSASALVTKFLSVFSGLAIVLRFLVPHLVRILLKFRIRLQSVAST